MSGWCHTDEFGLVDFRCAWMISDAEIRAYVRGHAAGRESVFLELEEDVAQVIRGAIAGIDIAAARRRPYAVPAWAGERA